MQPRMRLDVDWGDLSAAAVACSSMEPAAETARRIEQAWGGPGGALVCLSVRSGLDLYLRAIGLPRGSEVIVSAVTIPDMARILEHHGLVPVPVELDWRTLGPDLDDLAAAGTARTRAVLVAHLFGSRFDMEPLVELARGRGWLVLEDDAQAFGADGRNGHPGADVAMHSFGTIKTATALGGAVLRVGDGGVLARMGELQDGLAPQGRGVFAARVLRAGLLKLLAAPLLFGPFAGLCRLLGGDLDRLLHGAVRGFAGGDLLGAIRRRPSVPLLTLLERRLRTFDPARIAAREASGWELARRLPDGAEVPGLEAERHTFWTFPILARDPDRLVARLAREGLDATRRSSLVAIAGPDGPPPRAREALERIVFLPVRPGLSEGRRDRLVRAIAQS